MDNFLPASYEAPKSAGRYMKLVAGDNQFRVLENAIVGWEDWIDNKPVRTPFSQPKPEAHDPKKAVKHFWAFPVWDYKDGQIKILEITQSSIQSAIVDLHSSEDWGNPKGYDLVIKRTGESLETKYSVIPKPPKPLAPEISEALFNTLINLNALFTGDDPFASAKTPAQELGIDTDSIKL